MSSDRYRRGRLRAQGGSSRCPISSGSATAASPATVIAGRAWLPRRRCPLVAAVIAALAVWLLPIASAAASSTTQLGSIGLGYYWSANAGYGAAPPTAYLTTDDYGEEIVHLQGGKAVHTRHSRPMLEPELVPGRR